MVEEWEYITFPYNSKETRIAFHKIMINKLTKQKEWYEERIKVHQREINKLTEG